MVNSFIWSGQNWEKGDFDFFSLSNREGVYETFLIRDGLIQNKNLHFERFIAGCRFLNLPESLGPDIPKNLDGEWTLRWARWHGCPAGNIAHLWKGTLQPKKKQINVGLVSVQSVPEVPELTVKHLGLLKRVELKKNLKKEYGWDDYLVVDQGKILEGSNWGFMILMNGKWIIPHFKKGLLQSTTLTKILREGEFEGVDVIQDDISLSDLKQANSLKGPSSSGFRNLNIVSDKVIYF